MVELDEKIDDDIGKTISTKCIKGHKFQVPKEKIQTSSTGKSFVTLCPKCNGVARLRKDEVYELFGINPRDHVAVGKLYESLAIGSTPAQGQTSQSPPTVGGAPDGSPVDVPPEDEDDDEDDEDGDDFDEEDDDEDDEDEDEDEEFTAIVETVPDVTGKKKSVSRFRVTGYEDDDEEPEDDPRDRTPVKASKKVEKPAKKPRAKAQRREVEEDDEMDEEQAPTRQPRSRGRASIPAVEETEFDPNDVLKDLIEESGLDETTIGRIFDYIDMQPDGWQPAAIQGVLQMYISPGSATKISQRYQAELYREEKRRAREQQMMNLIGNPSGNMKLFDPSVPNTSPINSPLRQAMPGFAPNGSQFPQGGQFTPQGQFAQQGQFAPQGQFSNDPYATSRGFLPDMPRAPAPRGVSALDVERLIDAKLDGVVEKLAKAMGESKREDLMAQEAKEMRMMMLELLKTNMTAKSADDSKPDPMLTQLMTNQASMLNTLMQDRLSAKPADPMYNPLMKILLQETLSKKPTSAPPLATTSEELSQRIQLQRLANELELAQADFKDKQDGRAFTRDLAGQALSKIGESVASAYIETQRIQAEAQKEIAAQQARAVGMTRGTPQGAAAVQMATAPQVGMPQQPEDAGSEPSAMHKVRGVPSSDGTVTMPCPTCGSTITAKPGDTTVICNVCKTTYKATAKPSTRVETEDSHDEGSHEAVDNSPTGDDGSGNRFPEDDGSEMETRDGSTRDDWGTSGGVVVPEDPPKQAEKSEKKPEKPARSSKHIL